MPIDPAKSENETVDLLLQILGRTAVVAACVLMVLFDKDPFHSVVSPVMLLLEISVYNLAAAIYGRNLWSSDKSRVFALIVGDIVEASVVVGISGGYDSPFFAVFLFTMAEIALYLGWRIASALIVSINAVQVIATGIQIAAMRDILSRAFIASRFARLLIVGLLFVILAEILRREEASRRRAMRASRQIAELNSIFSQLGQAHLDIRKVFDTVLHAATTLDGVLFGAILEKRRPDTQWMVSATSNPDYCQLAARISVPPELETEPFSSMLTDDGSEAIFPCLRNARRMIVGNLQEFPSSESGMLVVAKTTAAPLDEDDESFLRALTMQAQLALHNASIFNERERQLEQLKAFKEIQNTFFSSAAHELKTPLTVLGLLASTLAISIRKPTVEQREMLETIDKNVARLKTLAANILATARLEAMDVAVHVQPTDMRRLIALVVDEMETLLLERGLSLSFDPPGPWRKVSADPARIREVVANLLTNAGKFAEPPSGIVVRFRADGERATLSVCNRGKPVSEDELDTIFEKYYTGRDAGALAGTGLGLYIARQLVTLHGGELWAENGEDGTCFQFTLQLARDEESDE